MAGPDLQKEIDAYERMLPQVRAQHGTTWALIAHQSLQGAFDNFHEAATHAQDHFHGVQVLIRHTGGNPVSLPFVLVEAE